MFWIGANDEAEEGTFVWEDGNNFCYMNWEYNEPNNWDPDEDCVVVNKGGRWNDLYCYRHRYYACRYTDP